MNLPSGTKRKWLEDHADYAGDDCLIWPFLRWSSGYGYLGAPAVGAHRYMCGLKNGSPPTPQHQAAHSCARGHEGCVHPLHLSWKTNAENQLERFQHSGPTKATKLTVAQVAEIRALKGTKKTGETAKQYGISETTVRDIQSGRARNSARPRRVFEDHEILLIRSTRNKTAAQLAKEYGCTVGVIDRIRQRVSHTWAQSQLSSAQS